MRKTGLVSVLWAARPSTIIGILVAGLVVLAFLFLAGKVGWKVFYDLPFNGETTQGRVEPMPQNRGGVEYHIEVDGQSHICGPLRGEVPTAETASVTYLPERPSTCRATAWVGRLTADELYLVLLASGLLIAWLIGSMLLVRRATRLHKAMAEEDAGSSGLM